MRPRATRAVLWGAICGLWIAVSPAVAREPVHVYVQPDEFLGSVAAELGSHARTEYRFEATSVDSDAEVVRRVGSDPRAVGVVQRDDYLRDARGPGGGSARFEFYGDVPACLVIVAAGGSRIRSYRQLVSPSPHPAATIDVGPEVGRVARMLDALWRVVPPQANLRLEHAGGSRALSRVVAGDIDAAAMLMQPPFADGLLDRLVDDRQVVLVPFDMPPLIAEASERGLPYRSRDIEIGRGGWFFSGYSYRTLCTTVGVIVNAAADLKLSEAVARGVLKGRFAAPRRGWLAAAGALVAETVALASAAVDWTREVVVAMLGVGSPDAAAVAGAGPAAPPVVPASHRVRDSSAGRPPAGSAGDER